MADSSQTMADDLGLEGDDRIFFEKLMKPPNSAKLHLSRLVIFYEITKNPVFLSRSRKALTRIRNGKLKNDYPCQETFLYHKFGIGTEQLTVEEADLLSRTLASGLKPSVLSRTMEGQNGKYTFEDALESTNILRLKEFLISTNSYVTPFTCPRFITEGCRKLVHYSPLGFDGNFKVSLVETVKAEIKSATRDAEIKAVFDHPKSQALWQEELRQSKYMLGVLENRLEEIGRRSGRMGAGGGEKQPIVVLEVMAVSRGLVGYATSSRLLKETVGELELAGIKE